MWILTFFLLQGEAVIIKHLATFNTEEQCIFKQYEYMPYLEQGELLECLRISNNEPV